MGTDVAPSIDDTRLIDLRARVVAAEERIAALEADNETLVREKWFALRDRDRFLAIAGHELRTPVAGIKGYA